MENNQDSLFELIKILRAEVAASHLIVMEGIRDLQEAPFDRTAEANRLFDEQREFIKFFNSGPDALRRVLERRSRPKSDQD